MKERDRIERRMRTCRHFTGIQHDTCRAGVDYLSVRDTSVRPFRWPCLDPESPVLCEKRSTYTREEVKERLAEIDASLRRIGTIREAILKDANGEVGITGEIPCPACGEGRVRYSVASLNGHVHAVCSTSKCAQWVE